MGEDQNKEECSTENFRNNIWTLVLLSLLTTFEQSEEKEDD